MQTNNTKILNLLFEKVICEDNIATIQYYLVMPIYLNTKERNKAIYFIKFFRNRIIKINKELNIYDRTSL